MEPLWQIRDVKHGKVFSFPAFDDMVDWLIFITGGIDEKEIQDESQEV